PSVSLVHPNYSLLAMSYQSMSDGYSHNSRGRSMSGAAFDSFVSDSRSSSRPWAGSRDSRDGRRLADSRRPRFSEDRRRDATSRSQH
ncbi:unnamed protein product, partial [Ectocarpus sp. 12 AP-2014]